MQTAILKKQYLEIIKSLSRIEKHLGIEKVIIEDIVEEVLDQHHAYMPEESIGEETKQEESIESMKKKKRKI
uniref:Uncharacterized protein n=1 Tax=viral metagenome TaxID=1070528 RepID=A0A6M3LAP4_9ZZZZ